MQAPNRLTIGNYTQRMTFLDTVFTSQSATTDNVDLPIPGVPTGAADASEKEMWKTVLSIGAKGSGLALHEHGAAWLALGSGLKEWVAFSPSRAPSSIYNAINSTQYLLSMPLPDSLKCVQTPGSIVLMPAGFIHATANLQPSWAIGRQRQWDAEVRYNIANPHLNSANLPISAPLPLLNAGLALKAMAVREYRETEQQLAETYVESAIGMLATVAGLNTQRDLRGKVLPGQPPPPPDVLRIRAALALIDVASVAPANFSFKRQPVQPFWSGPRGLPVAREAAQTAEAVLREAAVHASGFTLTSAAELLDRIGLWWLSRQETAAAASLFVAARSISLQSLKYTQISTTSISTKGVYMDSTLHAGVTLAMRSDCAPALPFLREAEQSFCNWMLPYAPRQIAALQEALRHCQ